MRLLGCSVLACLLAGCATPPPEQAPPQPQPQPQREARLQPLPADSKPRPASQALTGMFLYLADAASFTFCDDGRRFPVAMEGDYKALEAAYLAARTQAGLQPGQPVLATIDGRFVERPAAEAGRPALNTVVVDRFAGVWPRETCGTPLADSPLRGTYWKLVRLGDVAVPGAEKQREAHLLFAGNEPRVSGSGGCNRVSGGFTLEGDQLRLTQMLSTRMACPAGMDLEQQFLQALEKAQRWRIQGSHLELLDSGNAMVARFEAVAPR